MTDERQAASAERRVGDMPVAVAIERVDQCVASAGCSSRRLGCSPGCRRARDRVSAAVSPTASAALAVCAERMRYAERLFGVDKAMDGDSARRGFRDRRSGGEGGGAHMRIAPQVRRATCR